MTALLLSSLLILALDLYAAHELTYAAYVAMYTTVGRSWMDLMDGYYMADYAGLGGARLMTAHTLSRLTPPGAQPLEARCSTEYFKVYEVRSDRTLGRALTVRARTIFEVAKELSEGLYLVEKYAYLVRGGERIMREPALISRAVLEKRGSVYLFTYFDYPWPMAAVPKCIARVRAEVRPPWYATLKLYALYLYPACAALLSLLAARGRAPRRAALAVVSLSALGYAYLALAGDYSLLFHYARAFNPPFLAALTPYPPSLLLAPHLQPSPLLALKRGNFTVPCGVLVNVELPWNATAPLTSLMNETALGHLRVFAEVMGVDRVAVCPGPNLRLAFRCRYERVGKCYLVSLSDLGKVLVSSSPPYVYFESVAGGVARIELPWRGERCVDSLCVGVAVTVGCVVASEG